MNEATVNQANEVIDIATTACDYHNRTYAIMWATKIVEQREGVKFNAHLERYIERHTHS